MDISQDPDIIRGIKRVTGETFNADTGQWTRAIDDGYDLLAVRIRRGTTIDGAIVALCPDAARRTSPPTCASTARRSRDHG